MRVLVRTVTSLGIGTRVNEVIKALAATLNNNLATSAGTGLRLLSSRRHGWFRSRGGSGDFLASLSVETLALLADAQLSFLAFLAVAFARARPTSIRESSCTLTAAISNNDATRLGALGLTLRRRKWRWLERWRDRRTGGGGGGARLGSHLTRRDAVRAIVAMVLFAFAYRNLVREIFVASTGTKAAGVGLERKEARELNQRIQCGFVSNASKNTHEYGTERGNTYEIIHKQTAVGLSDLSIGVSAGLLGNIGGFGRRKRRWFGRGGFGRGFGRGKRRWFYLRHRRHRRWFLGRRTWSRFLCRRTWSRLHGIHRGANVVARSLLEASAIGVGIVTAGETAAVLSGVGTVGTETAAETSHAGFKVLLAVRL